jgi:hypothetical protein
MEVTHQVPESYIVQGIAFGENLLLVMLCAEEHCRKAQNGLGKDGRIFDAHR